MSLEHYRWGRVLVLKPQDSAYDAARAMESNHVGAVIVQELGKVVGILTDRDLAIRVIGFQLDPARTELRTIMSENPACLPLDASEQDAIELMRVRHVRRIPILDSGRAVGMLTLDDLVLSRKFDQLPLAEIVREQLAEPSPLKPRGATHPTKLRRPAADELAEQRHQAHADQTFNLFVKRLEHETGLPAERALTAFEVVASALMRRLTATEAAHFAAQLPSRERERLLEIPAGPDRRITRQVIDSEMASALAIGEDAAAPLVSKLGALLGTLVSEGEIEDVKAQLPGELRGLVEAVD